MRQRVVNNGKYVLLEMQGHDGGPEGDEHPWGCIEFNSYEALGAYLAEQKGRAADLAPSVDLEQLAQQKGGLDRLTVADVAEVAATVEAVAKA